MLEKEADYNKQDALARLLALLNQLKEWMIAKYESELNGYCQKCAWEDLKASLDELAFLAQNQGQNVEGMMDDDLVTSTSKNYEMQPEPAK
ncbi:hypothetical protein EDD86DRAFT_248766 [Gorgonomyces haynaldii]|nr:hypothetical protein EDD86DRAFT_248766 [Gorgonomyces haynaldii]